MKKVLPLAVGTATAVMSANAAMYQRQGNG